MSSKPSRRPKPKPETDLFGEPVRDPPPRLKPIERRDGLGWDVGVFQLGTGSTYVGLGGVYATEGEAWQAIRSGVGSELRGRSETVRVCVYVSPSHRRR